MPPFTHPSCLLPPHAPCLLQSLSAKTLHKVTWARTSVELFIEAAWGKRACFVAQQRAQLDELHAFVVQASAARRSGAAARGAGGKEMTTFERARAEWGQATVSARGKVGSGGDAAANAWLG